MRIPGMPRQRRAGDSSLPPHPLSAPIALVLGRRLLDCVRSLRNMGPHGRLAVRHGPYLLYGIADDNAPRRALAMLGHAWKQRGPLAVLRTMQHDDGALWCVADVCHHAIKVQPYGVGVEVAVLLPLQAAIRTNVFVVAPGRIGQVHSRARHELVDEFRAYSQRPCA